ncbi:RrF2 family transcriptional regulator [Thalassotalea atypica]|uniref:RrF2 family transcriptional regulator n=1 Tax=Thalassotalea atypica TaxID=2054316 RepID=UPI00257262DB|nr:Rrf2 family transcriptional regulator [Thalassotalea atypica]
MQLTHFTDLGIRVLMYLTYSRSEPVKISEIAEQFKVPRNHLIKVVNKLANLEWILTTRGRNGGLQLAVPPESITLATIIKALEECNQLIDCENALCRLRMGCQVKQYLDFGLKAFYDEMERYTLADSVTGQTGNKIIEMHVKYA